MNILFIHQNFPGQRIKGVRVNKIRYNEGI